MPEYDFYCFGCKKTYTISKRMNEKIDQCHICGEREGFTQVFNPTPSIWKTNKPT